MRALLAEFFGTMALVFIGTGAIVLDSLYGGVGTWGIAVAFGGIVGLMILLLARFSGAHFNPAVTIGTQVGSLFFNTSNVAAVSMWIYILADTIGSILAVLVFRITNPAEYR